MNKATAIAALAATLLTGAATGAFAAEANVTAPRPRNTPQDFTAQAQPQAPMITPSPRKSLQWDSQGKWGLRLDLNQSPVREPDWKDIQAGAFFRISPSVRVGGSVGVGNRLSQPRQVMPGDATPRVHLETAFRF
jgi:hypothetical protein